MNKCGTRCVFAVCRVWLVCCDADKWCRTPSSRLQRLNPSGLPLLISSCYYVSVRESGRGCPLSARRQLVLSPRLRVFRSLFNFFTLWLYIDTQNVARAQHVASQKPVFDRYSSAAWQAVYMRKRVTDTWILITFRLRKRSLWLLD